MNRLILKSQQHRLIMLVVFANVATLSLQLSAWLIGLIVICLLWQLSVINTPKRVFNRQIVIVFALSGCILLAINAKSLGLLLAMVHLLCFSYALKMLELKKRSDFYQLFFIGLFLLAASFIFQQTLAYFAVFTIILILNISLLFAFFTGQQPVKLLFRQSTVLLLQSIPLAIALFLLFPKLAPFWQVPIANSAKTGLSNEVSVGDVANLALSNERAFRVTFEGTPPSYQQLYWRTLVLDSFDGKTWRQAQPINKMTTRQRSLLSVKHPLSGEAVQYQIIAEPSFQHWLFALDLATSKQSDIRALSDFTLYKPKVISQLYSYQVSSYLQAPLNKTLSVKQQQDNLVLPQGSNPRLLKAGRALRAKYPKHKQRIQAILNQFNEDAYFYTLNPPLLGEHALDEFYFQSKAGFCEHYASSFAFLMRAAGIPARLVVGYLGGEYNQQGQFYTVKQRDAHAWTEVWLQGKGWQRVDPTAAVSPERVEQGFSDELFAERLALSGEMFSFEQLAAAPWLRALKLQFDRLDYQWTKWVIGYNASRQMNLLKKWLGKPQVWKVALVLASVFVMLLLMLTFINRQKSPAKLQSPWLQYYLTLIQLLKQRGLACEQAMTALQISEQVSKEFPTLKACFDKFFHSFQALQYQTLPQEKKQQLISVIKQQYQQCKLALKQIKPKS